MLMAAAERFARGEGAHVLRLGVLDKNEAARRFYARQGFGEQAHVLTKRLDEPAPGAAGIPAARADITKV